MWLTTHSFGIYSNFITFLVISLCIKKKYFYATFFSITLLAIHPIVGLYVNAILVTIMLFKFRNIIFDNNVIKGYLAGFIIVLISFLFYRSNYININNIINELDYNDYIKFWDYHRNLIKFNYQFIILQIFAIIILFLEIKKEKNLGIYLLLTLCIIGLLLYLSRSFFININFFNRIMVSRFSILTSIPSAVIIFNYLINKAFQYYFKFFFKINSLTIILFFIAIIKFISIFQFEFKRLDYLYKDIYSKSINTKDVLENLNKNSYGNILTTVETTRTVLLEINKPFFLYAESIDYIPYIPQTLTEIKDIITNLYGIDFNNPPNEYRHKGGLSEPLIKDVFENRSHYEWVLLSKKYKFNTVIVPNNWKLNLQGKFNGPNYTVCYIQ